MKKISLYLAVGLALVLLQGSKIFPAIGIKYSPDLVIVYLMFILAYSNISPELLIFIGFFIGMVVDVMSGNLLLACFIYPAVAVVFLMFRDRFLQPSFVVKLVLFPVVNAVYIFFYHIGIYIYSGQSPSLSDRDLYIFINNLTLFYASYLVVVYLNEKTT